MTRNEWLSRQLAEIIFAAVETGAWPQISERLPPQVAEALDPEVNLATAQLAIIEANERGSFCTYLL